MLPHRWNGGTSFNPLRQPPKMEVRELHCDGIASTVHETFDWQNIYVSSIAKDVWDVVCETYSDTENFSQIFAIKTQLW